AAHSHRDSVDRNNFADRCTDTIRTLSAALGEDSYFRPFRIFTRMPGFGYYVRRGKLIEVEQNLDVRKLTQAIERCGLKLRFVKTNLRDDVPPSLVTLILDF